jgi:hypothetical protein
MLLISKNKYLFVNLTKLHFMRNVYTLRWTDPSARKEIMRVIKSGNFCFRLCEALVSYEIVKPIKNIFRGR